MNKEQVNCTACGCQASFPQGYLTEDQKRRYLCGPCVSEEVVERRVVEQETGERRLLTEG